MIGFAICAEQHSAMQVTKSVVCWIVNMVTANIYVMYHELTCSSHKAHYEIHQFVPNNFPLCLKHIIPVAELQNSNDLDDLETEGGKHYV